jgi:hypothetical protein
MRIRIGSVAVVAVLSLICALPALGCQAATDVSGDWVLTWNFGGESRDVELLLDQTEEGVQGAWVGPFGGAPMEVNGTLEESAITLVIVMPPTASSPEITLTLTGMVEGDGMSGKLDFDGIAEGTWSARRPE